MRSPKTPTSGISSPPLNSAPIIPRSTRRAFEELQAWSEPVRALNFEISYLNFCSLPGQMLSTASERSAVDGSNVHRP